MSEKTAYASFSHDIYPDSAHFLLNVCIGIVQKGFDCIHLMMSSPGGNTQAGFHLYNQLRALPVQLITHNTGNIDSIANVIFLAGDPRYACSTSTFMFHSVHWRFSNENVTRVRLAEILSSVEAEELRMGNVFEERTDLTPVAYKELMDAGETKDAAFAKDKGIIEDICDVSIPAGSEIIPIGPFPKTS